MESWFTLVFVEGSDPVNRTAKCRTEPGVDPLEGRLPDAGVERPGAGLEVEPVESERVLADRHVAPQANVLENRAHRRAGFGIARLPPHQHRIEQVEWRSRQTPDHREPSR